MLTDLIWFLYSRDRKRVRRSEDRMDVSIATSENNLPVSGDERKRDKDRDTKDKERRERRDRDKDRGKDRDKDRKRSRRSRSRDRRDKDKYVFIDHFYYLYSIHSFSIVCLTESVTAETIPGKMMWIRFVSKKNLRMVKLIHS